MARKNELRILEICLICVCVGLLCLLYQIQGYKMVVLNLFFLPVVLTAFFLGRYRAGLLALFCAIGAAVVVTQQLDLISNASPLVAALSVVVWGAVLGMIALLVGTLSDERVQKNHELHEAYMGVVEVLSQYLQGAQPQLKTRTTRSAELSQLVAESLRMTPQQIDDVRIASLLYDLGDVEITSRVIRRAMGRVEKQDQHTFQGKDLVFSLGTVLSGALPLLRPGVSELSDSANGPLGAHVVRTVRLLVERQEEQGIDAEEALEQLRGDRVEEHHPAVLDALQRCLGRSAALAGV